MFEYLAISNRDHDLVNQHSRFAKTIQNSVIMLGIQGDECVDAGDVATVGGDVVLGVSADFDSFECEVEINLGELI
jgi:hypothetical protein